MRLGAFRSHSRKFPHPVEAESHIQSELSRGGIEFRVKSKDFVLNCPNMHTSGADSGFHLEITKDGTRAHCWVCDWSGSWNKLADMLGLAKFGDVVYEGTFSEKVASADVFKKLSDSLSSAFTEKEGALPSGLSPWKGGEWRGLSPSFLADLPSYSWDHYSKSEGYIPRILWPYYQFGRLVGYVGRRLDRKDKVRYYRAPWCKAKGVLFPFDRVVSSGLLDDGYLVLVEGEVDALNLLHRGVPALSLLGSTNWSKSKLDLFAHLDISRVFLMMDPDDAGKKATRVLRRELKGYCDTVKSISLDVGTDPGDLSKEDLKWLKKNVFLPRS